MRVFHVGSFGKDEPRFGESTLVVNSDDAVQVHLDGQKSATWLYASFVWPATPENLKLYHDHLEAMNKWRAQEPNMFAVLNKMSRRAT